jgi:hypothetical protein
MVYALDQKSLICCPAESFTFSADGRVVSVALGVMNIKHRKSLLAGVITTLMAAPGWLAAQQLQSPQTGSERHGQPTGRSPAPSGYQIRSLPEGALLATSPAGGATHGNDTLLSALTPQDLKQMDVVDVSEEKIGKIEDVVRSRKNGFIYAVVSSGGVWGIGAKVVTVPVEELAVQDDKLRIGATMDELQRWPEYQEDQHVALEPANTPISNFATFEAHPLKRSESAPE